MRIMLDPGHGAGPAHNRGFIGGNEGDFNYKACVEFQKYMQNTYQNVSVGLTRNKITDDPTLQKRGEMARGYDLLISWHTNAFNGQARGCEIWDDVNPKFSNKALADKITKRVAGMLNTADRGTKYKKNDAGGNWYGVLRNGYAKSNMILEVCFHDNRADITAYLNHFHKTIWAIADTIASHYGLKKKVVAVPVPTPAPSTGTAASPDWLKEAISLKIIADKDLDASMTRRDLAWATMRVYNLLKGGK